MIAVLGSLLLPMSANAQSDIIISELMPDPDAVADREGEYIELYNQTGSSIDLSGWTLDVDGDTDGLDGVTVPAEGFAVLCVEGTAAENGGIENCATDYVDGISLVNGGSTIELRNGSGSQVDVVTYDDTDPWPNPTGASLEFVGAPGDDNNAGANWQEATTRKGDFAGDNGDYGSPNANASGGQLPVELAVFDVAANGNQVHLAWKTATETNNAGFEVQRRTDGGWSKSGFVEGAGTTTRPQSYRFTTDALKSGTHTFRLKQIDTDGTAHVSEPETVTIRGEAGLVLSGANPLTAGQPTELQVQVETEQFVEVALYDVLGQRVRTVTSDRATPDRPVRTTMSTEGLSSGVYFLRATGNSFQETRKINVLQ